jgi:hypothetical protein
MRRVPMRRRTSISIRGGAVGLPPYSTWTAATNSPMKSERILDSNNVTRAMDRRIELWHEGFSSLPALKAHETRAAALMQSIKDAAGDLVSTISILEERARSTQQRAA